MKKFRKIMAVLVAALMIAATMVPAWAAERTVTVTYSDTYKTSGTIPEAASVTIQDGDDSAVFTVNTSNDLARDGYTLIGWSTDQPSGVDDIKATVSKLEVKANTTLYGVWKKNNQTLFSIKIDNAFPSEKYTFYKLFDVTYSGDSDGQSVPAAPNPDNTHAHSAYAYTIKDTYTWWNTVTRSHNKSDSPFTTTDGLVFTKNTNANEWNVEFVEGTFDAASYAAYLNQNKTGLTDAVKINAYTAPGKDFTVYPGDDGYYFVDTTMGSFCSLDTNEPNATIREKNTMPTLEKKVKNDAGTFGTEPVTRSIGDVVEYSITVTDGKGTDTTLTVHDILSNGLTLIAKEISVAAPEGKSFTKGDDYSVVYSTSASNIDYTGLPESDSNTFTYSKNALADGCTFEVIFTPTGTAKVLETENVTISYKAKVNSNAVIGDAGNDNTAKLTYSQQTSKEKKATVKTYAAALYKYNQDGSDLPNATFEMKDANSKVMYFDRKQKGTSNEPAVYQYDSTYVETTENVDNLTKELITPASGAILIYGLNDEEYTFTETSAPDGYYPLTNSQTLKVWATTGVLPENIKFELEKSVGAEEQDKEYATYTINQDDKYVSRYELYISDSSAEEGNQPANNVKGIENHSGSELPSTGGMGTTVLYIVGGMLVILAGAYLFFSKKRTA